MSPILLLTELPFLRKSAPTQVLILPSPPPLVGLEPKSDQAGLPFPGALLCMFLETLTCREIRPNLKLDNTQVGISQMLHIHLFIQQTFIEHFLCYLPIVLEIGDI